MSRHNASVLFFARLLVLVGRVDVVARVVRGALRVSVGALVFERQNGRERRTALRDSTVDRT